MPLPDCVCPRVGEVSEASIAESWIRRLTRDGSDGAHD